MTGALREKVKAATKPVFGGFIHDWQAEAAIRAVREYDAEHGPSDKMLTARFGYIPPPGHSYESIVEDWRRSMRAALAETGEKE